MKGEGAQWPDAGSRHPTLVLTTLRHPYLSLGLPGREAHHSCLHPCCPSFFSSLSTCLKNSFEEPRDLARHGEDAWVSKGGTEPLEVHQGPKGRGMWTGVMFVPSNPSINRNVCGPSTHLGSPDIRRQKITMQALLEVPLKLLGFFPSHWCHPYSLK